MLTIKNLGFTPENNLNNTPIYGRHFHVSTTEKNIFPSDFSRKKERKLKRESSRERDYYTNYKCFFTQTILKVHYNNIISSLRINHVPFHLQLNSDLFIEGERSLVFQSSLRPLTLPRPSFVRGSAIFDACHDYLKC